MDSRIRSIDGWRAIAALGVLYTHVWVTLGLPSLSVAGVEVMHFLNLWGNGVQLFFVISGFCFYLVLKKYEKYDLQTIIYFWRKRWLRIAPAFYTICIFLAFIHYGPFNFNTFYKLFLNFIFLQNHLQEATIDATFWSLAVEWHFYLLLPVVFIAINRFDVKKVIVAIIISCFFLNVLHFAGFFLPGPGWGYLIFTNIGHFAWGILLGFIYKNHILFSFLTNTYSLLAGLIVAYIGKFLFSSLVLKHCSPLLAILFESTGPLVMTFGFGMMIYTTLFNPFSSGLIGNKVLSIIGEISYSFYLWHSSIIFFLYHNFHEYIPATAAGVFLFMALTLLILLPISYITYTLLESFYFKRRASKLVAKPANN